MDSATPIPLSSIANLSSLDAVVTLTANGLVNERPAQGDLRGELTMNGARSKVAVSGSLLGEIAAQVGGSMVSLFTPRTVDLYKMPDGAYIVVNGLFSFCVKPNAPKTIAVLDQMSPQRLLLMLTSSDAAYGRLVGETMMDGRAVKHYIIDGDAFLANARLSANPQLRTFADGLWTARDADLYVDAAGDFPVAFNGGYSGAFEPLKFKGLFDVQIALTAVNANNPVELPPSCAEPVNLRAP
jgi:hypothetical protein